MKKYLIVIFFLVILTSGCNLSQTNELDNNSQSNSYDPHLVSVGDTINGFRVVDIYLDDSSGMEKVEFDGTFTLTGVLLPNIVGGSKYGILVSKEEIINNLPIATTWGIEKYDSNFKQFFRILSDEKVLQEIGREREEKITQNAEQGIEVMYRVTATFSNYTYLTQPQTDISSSLELVEILSIEEIE